MAKFNRMDKVFSSKKTKPSINLNNVNNFSNRICSQFNNKLRSNEATSNSLKNEPFNITNFYSQKKRIHLISDSSDATPIRSPLKKHRKSIDNEYNDSQPVSLPITWETANTSVDCKLNIKHDSINSQIKSQDTSLSFKNNGDKLDKVLNEFYVKLQFNEPSLKVEDRDSGNEEDKAMANEFDDMLDDSWDIKDINELNKLEHKIASKEISKESGIGSCNSLDINKQNASPLLINGSQGDKDIQINKNNFKIPETPAKCSIKMNPTNSSIQFNSTPKVVSRQSSKLNQGLNFEDISPIKGNDNSLVNIRQESKRPLNDSIDQEITSSKKRNTGKILFGQSNNEKFDKQMNVQINKQKSINQTNEKVNQKDQYKNEDDFGDDLEELNSFETILSQFDDKALTSNCKQLKQSTNNDQPVKRFKQDQQYQQKTIIQKKIYANTQPNYQPKKNSIYSNDSCTPPSSFQSTKTPSSLQFEFESLSPNNLNDKFNKPNQRDLFGNEMKQDKLDNNIYLFDEDEADMICQSQFCD